MVVRKKFSSSWLIYSHITSTWHVLGILLGINIDIFDFKNNVWWQLGYFAAPPGTKISPPLRRKDPTGEEGSFSWRRSKLIRLIPGVYILQVRGILIPKIILQGVLFTPNKRCFLRKNGWKKPFWRSRGIFYPSFNF